MRIKKGELILFSLTAIYQMIQWYLWVYRWGGADSKTYFYKSETFENIFSSTVYELSSYLYKPWFQIFGYSVFVLMLAAFFYRIFIYKIIDNVNKPIIKSILISFTLFPLHALLSFFPGRDLFAILFIYLSISYALKNKYLLAFLLALCASKFRILISLPLIFSLIFEIFRNIPVKSQKIVKLVFALIVLSLSIVWLINNFSILGYGIKYEYIINRAQAEVKPHFNLQGFKSFPLSLLNLYFPLISPRIISPYTFLGIESFLASLLIINGFLKSNLYRIPRIIINTSIIQLFLTVLLCAIYPNVTDIARKIYPLFFYASLIFYYRNNFRKIT